MNTNKVLNKVPRRVWMLGTDQYVLPFIASGYYVSDKNGRTVLEAQSFQAAMQLAALLNAQALKD